MERKDRLLIRQLCLIVKGYKCLRWETIKRGSNISVMQWPYWWTKGLISNRYRAIMEGTCIVMNFLTIILVSTEIKLNSRSWFKGKDKSMKDRFNLASISLLCNLRVETQIQVGPRHHFHKMSMTLLNYHYSVYMTLKQRLSLLSLKTIARSTLLCNSRLKNCMK